jgi:O-acetyl-ADP-ribose deacetylase (regulator of RNase III)
MDVKIKNTTLSVQQGDLLQLDVEVLVSPTTPDLWMGKGISAQIVAQGGEEIHEDAKKTRYAEFGDVVVSIAGQLRYKAIYHVVVIPRDLQPDRKAITKAVTGSLAKADATQIKTIGFPMLGSATVKFPYDTYAGVMLRAAIEYLMQNDSHLEKVTFCLYNKECFTSFQNQLNILRQEYLF